MRSPDTDFESEGIINDGIAEEQLGVSLHDIKILRKSYMKK